MKRTDNLYKELKEKIENLVEFMVSNDLNSADINLEISKEFTLCNVKYKDCDDIKDEFLYLYDSSEKLKESYYKKLKSKESGYESSDNEEVYIPSSDKSEESNEPSLTEDLTNNEVQSDKPTVASDTASEIKENKVVTAVKNNVEDTKVEDVKAENTKVEDVKTEDTKVDAKTEDLSNNNKQSKQKPIEKANNTNADNVNKNDTNTTNVNRNTTNKNNKDSSKHPINFKEEFAFQKEIILSVLKEYNLIS